MYLSTNVEGNVRKKFLCDDLPISPRQGEHHLVSALYSVQLKDLKAWLLLCMFFPFKYLQISSNILSWFLFFLCTLPGMDHVEVTSWLSQRGKNSWQTLRVPQGLYALYALGAADHWSWGNQNLSIGSARITYCKGQHDVALSIVSSIPNRSWSQRNSAFSAGRFSCSTFVSLDRTGVRYVSLSFGFWGLTGWFYMVWLFSASNCRLVHTCPMQEIGDGTATLAPWHSQCREEYTFGVWRHLCLPWCTHAESIHSVRVLARPFYWTVLFNFAHTHSTMAVPVGRTGLRFAVQVFDGFWKVAFES